MSMLFLLYLVINFIKLHLLNYTDLAAVKLKWMYCTFILTHEEMCIFLTFDIFVLFFQRELLLRVYLSHTWNNVFHIPWRTDLHVYKITHIQWRTIDTNLNSSARYISMLPYRGFAKCRYPYIVRFTIPYSRISSPIYCFPSTLSGENRVEMALNYTDPIEFTIPCRGATCNKLL